MKVILHDLESLYDGMIEKKCDRAVSADGKYAPCQGCFGCWTRHPAECGMKDKLWQISRVIGQADAFRGKGTFVVGGAVIVVELFSLELIFAYVLNDVSVRLLTAAGCTFYHIADEL